jgi:hypothetical protein
MEHTNNGSATVQKLEHTNALIATSPRNDQLHARRLVGIPGLAAPQEVIGKTHACRASQRGFHQAAEHLKRANRDLGETAAVVAASLSTATAVEAVINFAIDKIGLPREVLQVALVVYMALFVLILLWGAFRARGALRRRYRAEKDIDQAQKGIFEFCPGDPWEKLDER